MNSKHVIENLKDTEADDITTTMTVVNAYMGDFLLNTKKSFLTIFVKKSAEDDSESVPVIQKTGKTAANKTRTMPYKVKANKKKEEQPKDKKTVVMWEFTLNKDGKKTIYQLPADLVSSAFKSDIKETDKKLIFGLGLDKGAYPVLEGQHPEVMKECREFHAARGMEMPRHFVFEISTKEMWIWLNNRVPAIHGPCQDLISSMDHGFSWFITEHNKRMQVSPMQFNPILNVKSIHGLLASLEGYKDWRKKLYSQIEHSGPLVLEV